MKAEIVRWKEVREGDRFLHPAAVDGLVRVTRIMRSDSGMTVYFASRRGERHMAVSPNGLVAIVAR